MTHFKGKPPIRIQPVEVNDIEVIRKLAAHLGLSAKIAESIIEFEVEIATLRGWVLLTKNFPSWYDKEFFNNLISLDAMDRVSFSCPAIPVESWHDLPGEVLF